METKIILLTGGSSGIGYDTAGALARQGHKVYAAARRIELIEPLRPLGVIPCRLDITDEASAKELVERIMADEGRIDVLVNNAGYGSFGPLETVPLEEARRQLEVNVFGLARLTSMVIPHMREKGGGRIVNIASIAGRMVLPYGGWYHVSKYSVEAFSDALRIEAKPFGIDVSIIEPGAIKTAWGQLAADHLKDSSRGTPYEETASREAALMEKVYSGKYLSSPAVITKAISRAVNSRRPKVRYRTGRFSGIAVFAHSVLPARWWDAIMRGFLKTGRRGTVNNSQG